MVVVVVLADVVDLGVGVFVVATVVTVVVAEVAGGVEVMEETDDTGRVDEEYSVDRLEMEELDNAEDVADIEGEDVLEVVEGVVVIIVAGVVDVVVEAAADVVV